MSTLIRNRTSLTVYPLVALAAAWTLIYGWAFTVEMCLKLFS
jgi:hypothetical protein